MTIEQAEKTEFTFPDEREVDLTKGKAGAADTDTDIEIVDDTPAADRGRKPMVEPPTDPTDDELASYSDGVRKRIQHFTKGYHEERRAKEAALREREEAVRVAQQLVAENQRLQGSLSQGQQAMLEQAKKTAASELVEAKKALKEAQEAFDTDAIVEAQERMFNAQIRIERVNNFKPAPVQQQQNVVQTQQAPKIDEKAQQWLAKNRWFGEDHEMSGFASGLHNKLVDEGVDPRSDEYYEQINARMREKFPERFEEDGGNTTTQQQQPQQRRSSNVAPATRSTAPKKIVLTETQVRLAKRLGVPLELYARQVAEEMRKPT